MSRGFEVLSSVESGINGPHSGPDHRNGGSEDSHMIAVSECAEHAKNTQTPTMAIVIPARGVQRPKSRSTPAIAAIRWGRLGANLAFSRRCEAPK